MLINLLVTYPVNVLLSFYGLQMVMPDGQALYPAFFITVAIRLLSVHYGVNLPQVRGRGPVAKL